MPTFQPPKKNTEYIFYVSLISQANTKIAQANPTLAAGDVKVATDDGAPADLGTLPVVDADFTKRVKVTLSASEMNGDNATVIFSDAAGAEWCDLTINIQTAARQIDDLAYPTVSGRSIDVSTGGEVGLDWANIGSPATAQNLSATNIDVDQVVASVSGAVGSVTGSVGSVTGSVGSVATNGITAASLAADASAEIADAVWDEDATGHQTQGSFGQVLGDSGADADTIWGLVNTNLDAAISSRASAAALSIVQSDTDDIQARLPAALVGGRMDSSVGAMAADVVTSAAIATDALGAAEFAQAAADKVWSSATRTLTAFSFGVTVDANNDKTGYALTAVYDPAKTAAQVGDAMTLTAGERNAVADATFDRADAIEVGLTLRQTLRLMASALAAKLSGAATTTVTIRNAVADSKNRIVATVDGDGNRSAITYDVS